MSVQKTEECEKWIQLAGHHGSIVKTSQRTISKLQPRGSMEASFYRSIRGDPISCITPRFVREFEEEDKKYIELEDLLQGFSDPCVLDIKMGTRTFLESETENFKERRDLYEKMIEVDPDEPSLEERTKRKVTKLRYMQFRENASSSSTLGLRLEALRLPGQAPCPVSKSCKTREQVSDILINTFAMRDPHLCLRFLQRLREIERCLLSSAVFRSHELVGSSLLLFWDESGRTDIRMIDFVKANPQQKIQHSIAWQDGNHEDGYLIGLYTLIQIFERYAVGTAL